MSEILKKVLLAVDGSDRSLDAVRYASEILNPENTNVVLFHVMRKIDQAFWDMGINPMGRQQMVGIRAWERAQIKNAEAFMKKSQKIFLKEGFPQESVMVNIKNRKQGIARDIIFESKTGGYDAVISGRRGVGKMKGLILGSVANKLAESVTQVPVWLVGKRANTEKILLGLDASKEAMRAVNYAGTMLGGKNITVTLMYIIRDRNIFKHQGHLFPPAEQAELILEGKEDIEPVFDEAKKRLIREGLEANRIDTWTITEVSSRAEALVGQAREKGYGTIIVGRKGLSNIAEFSMGRVCRKVIQMSKGIAVWVVN